MKDTLKMTIQVAKGRLADEEMPSFFASTSFHTPQGVKIGIYGEGLSREEAVANLFKNLKDWEDRV